MCHMASLSFSRDVPVWHRLGLFFEKGQYFVAAKRVRPVLNMRMDMHEELICALQA